MICLLKKAAFPALLLLAACQSTPSETQTAALPPVVAAEEAVMAQHDSLMAQTAQLYELKSKVGPASPASAPYLRGLEAANKSMMTWMHQYQQPDSTAPEAQRLAYFQEQQRQLAAVDRQIRQTIDSAGAFLKSAPATR